MFLLITLIVYTINPYKILHSFTRKRSLGHSVTCTSILMSEKKEKCVIYWLLITYTLTFIFFVSNLSKVTSDRVTFLKQQPLAYWFSIFYARKKVTFWGHFWVTRSLFVWVHLLTFPTFSPSIVKIHPTVTFAKMTLWKSRALKNLSNSKPNNKNSGAATPLCCDPAFIRNFRKYLKNSPNNASQTYIWPHLTAFRVFLRHFRLICLHSWF